MRPSVAFCITRVAGRLPPCRQLWLNLLKPALA